MKCHRTACKSTINIIYKHKQTGDMYCPQCARKINDANPLRDGSLLIERTPGAREIVGPTCRKLQDVQKTHAHIAMNGAKSPDDLAYERDVGFLLSVIEELQTDK